MNLAILGYGTVGKGVVELVRPRKDLCVRAVLVRREHPELGDLAVTDIAQILNDPEIDTVIEVMGGLHPGLEYVTAAIRAGKNVVTANKFLICRYFNVLTSLAISHGVALRYTAAAGGGIPWLVNLERARRADRMEEIHGILNGTTNYILDTMQRTELDFSICLQQAQALGYAEADPTDDLEGRDMQRKLILSAKLAFDSLLAESQVPIAGISAICREDLANFSQGGLSCRMMAHAMRIQDGVCAYVEPTLVKDTAMEASVPSNFNFVTLVGQNVGRLSFFGQGAGRYPTAMNVVQDCLDILTDVAPLPWAAVDCPVYDTAHRYYVRTAQMDEFLHRHIAYSLGSGLITEPVSMQEMHQYLIKKRETEPSCFAAGLWEE